MAFAVVLFQFLSFTGVLLKPVQSSYTINRQPECSAAKCNNIVLVINGSNQTCVHYILLGIANGHFNDL